MRISDWSSDVCSSDLPQFLLRPFEHEAGQLLAEGVVDLLQGVAGDGEGFRERPAHADGLGALSRKDASHGHGRLLREYGGGQKGLVTDLRPDITPQPFLATRLRPHRPAPITPPAAPRRPPRPFPHSCP